MMFMSVPNIVAFTSFQLGQPPSQHFKHGCIFKIFYTHGKNTRNETPICSSIWLLILCRTTPSTSTQILHTRLRRLNCSVALCYLATSQGINIHGFIRVEGLPCNLQRSCWGENDDRARPYLPLILLDDCGVGYQFIGNWQVKERFWGSLFSGPHRMCLCPQLRYQNVANKASRPGATDVTNKLNKRRGSNMI